MRKKNLVSNINLPELLLHWFWQSAGFEAVDASFEMIPDVTWNPMSKHPGSGQMKWN